MVEIQYKGVTFKRNPNAEQRANRVYFAPPRGSQMQSLHCEIYKDHHGAIPEGFVVHHHDGDSLNNDPANLVALSCLEHAAAHPVEVTEQMRERLKKAGAAAAKWHGSPEGLAWHREHGRKTWEDREPVGKVNCQECGKRTTVWFKGKRFCSRKCCRRTADRERRYESRVECPVCTSGFWRSKYRAKPETCSRKCGAKLRKRRSGCL